MTDIANDVLAQVFERLVRALTINDTPVGEKPDLDEAVGFVLVAHGGRISLLTHGLEAMEALGMARDLLQQEVARRPAAPDTVQ